MQEKCKCVINNLDYSIILISTSINQSFEQKSGHAKKKHAESEILSMRGQPQSERWV